MAWISLILSAFLETFAIAMINRLSVKRNWQTIIFIFFGLGSALGFLSYSLQTISIGSGYAIWTGMSVVGSSLIGKFYFGDSKSWLRIFFIALILSSAIDLKVIP